MDTALDDLEDGNAQFPAHAMHPTIDAKDGNARLPAHAMYPAIDAKDGNAPLSPRVAPSMHTSINIGVTNPPETNPYDIPASSRSSSMKVTMETMRDMVGRWSKRVGETTKAAEDLRRNVWQHLKTGPSFTEAAMGRIAHSTKVVAEGGYDKIFRKTFDNLPEERLEHSFACFLSTSAGPVMGTLYISTVKVAFSSDTALSYKVGNQTEWSYYKVAVPLHQLRAVKPSGSQANGAEKYIQIVSVDNQELWFMGFVSYDNAVKNLAEALKKMHDLHA